MATEKDLTARAAGAPLRVIRNPQDFSAGVTLLLLGVFVMWAIRDLPGMEGYRFGAGTAPFIFAVLLALGGAVRIVTGIVTHGAPITGFSFRGTACVLGATLFFAFTVEPLGLVIASFVMVVTAAAGSAEFRPVESLLWAAALTFVCSGLMVGLLNIPLPLWPAAW